MLLLIEYGTNVLNFIPRHNVVRWHVHPEEGTLVHLRGQDLPFHSLDCPETVAEYFEDPTPA